MKIVEKIFTKNSNGFVEGVCVSVMVDRNVANKSQIEWESRLELLRNASSIKTERFGSSFGSFD